MRRFALAAWLLALAGCGSVVELAADGGTPLESSDGAAGDVGVEMHNESPPPRDAVPAPSCAAAAADCAPCSAATSTGPGYPAGVCAAIVACVRAGAPGAYPLQACHNDNGGAEDWGGLSCVKALLERDCPELAL